MAEKFNALGLGYAAALLSAICMLLFGIFGNIGVYTSAVEQMIKWHLFFSLSIGGIIAGIIEASIWGFIGGYLFGLLYNKFA